MVRLHQGRRTRPSKKAMKERLNGKQDNSNPEKGGGTPLVVIASRYALGDLPTTETCEECESPMAPQEVQYQLVAPQVVIRAGNVPAQRCLGRCRGAWLPPEVTLDLVEQAIPILHQAGATDIANGLERERMRLQATIDVT